MLLIFYCILVLSLVFVIFYKSIRSLHMLQQNLYNENNRYLKWVSKNKKEIYKNLDMFGLLFTFLFAWGFNTYVAYYFTGVIVLLYIVCTYLFIKERKKDQNKKPLVITSRIKRLIITTMILYLIPCVCGYFIKSNLNDFIFCLISSVLNEFIFMINVTCFTFIKFPKKNFCYFILEILKVLILYKLNVYILFQYCKK